MTILPDRESSNFFEWQKSPTTSHIFGMVSQISESSIFRDEKKYATTFSGYYV